MTEAENKKYRQIMESGQRLILKHGIKRITVEEICRSADVSKMTFYKYFKNKDDLATAVLNELFDEGNELYNEIMSRDITYREKVKAIFNLKLEKSEEYGDSFLQEIYTTEGSFKDLLMERMEESMEMTMDLFHQGQEAGEIDRDMSPEFFIYISQQAQEMLRSEQLRQMIPDTKKRLDSLTRFYFYGLFGKDDKTG